MRSANFFCCVLKFNLWILDSELQMFIECRVKVYSCAAKQAEDCYVSIPDIRNSRIIAIYRQRDILLATGRKNAKKIYCFYIYRQGLYIRKSAASVYLTVAYLRASRISSNEHRTIRERRKILVKTSQDTV